MEYFIQYSFYVLIATLLFGLSSWKLFIKMGEPAWKAFIPFLNYATVLSQTGKPKWWTVLSYFPIVGPVMMSVFHVFLASKFGKKSTLDQILTVVLPFIYLAYINYSPKSEVHNDEKIEEFLLPGEKPAQKKETFVGSITFAVVFATLIHTFFIQPFGIPTGSMERTLLVGDFLFVNKLNYGFRMPMRPVAIPFLQGTIWDTGQKGNPKDDPKSYVDAVDLPYFRFPGWEEVKKKDIVVFNYPQDSVHTAIDRADPYVKRCAAVGGDVVEFKLGRLFVNGKEEVPMGDQYLQFAHNVVTDTELNINALYDQFGFLPVTVEQGDNGLFLYHFSGLTKEIAEAIRSYPGVKSVEEFHFPKDYHMLAYTKVADSNGNPLIDEKNQYVYSKKIDFSNSIFPANKNWNPDFYGPIAVPKRGDKIRLTMDNFLMYRWIISRYEGHTLDVKNGQFFIDGKPQDTYEVKYNYYMMIGDNRGASLDSRFFGFVPETHIMGKPLFTWMSLQGMFKDSNSQFQAPFKVRWDRMFKAANTGEANKTSYWWIAALVLILFFGWEQFMALFKKKKKDE